MKKVSFIKIHGAGNDFILFDMKENPSLEPDAHMIRNICARATGVGADGVLIIRESKEHDFALEYFNSDGSCGSLCGNGSRCAIKYAHYSGRTKANKTTFECLGKIYRGEIIDEQNVKFYLNEPAGLKLNFQIDALGQQLKASFIDTGSPHLVVDCRSISGKMTLKELPVYDFGKQLRYHKYLAPEGSNINFIEINDNMVYIRTYERGVEDETLACGTGSVASALICHYNEGLEPPITLITKGGYKLIVDFQLNNEKVENLSLTGPAEMVFSGVLF